MEEPDAGRGLGDTAPAAAGAVKHRPDQAQAGALARQPADDLGASAGLSKGPLDEVGVPDPMPVLAWEPQEHRQLGQGVQQAADRGWVALAIAVGERVGASAGLADRLVAGWGVDVVKDLPERLLDLGLGVSGDLGQQVAGTVGLYGNNVLLFVLLFRSDAIEVAWGSRRMLACNCRCGLGCCCRT